jgi:hypothetical protein
VALNLEQQQQQLYKLNAELANLKKEQSRLDNLTKGSLLKKFDPNLSSSKTILAQLASKTAEVNAKQAEYNALKKTFDAAKADTKVVSEVGSAEEARKAALAGYAPDQIVEYRADLAKQLADKKVKKQAEDNVQQGEFQSQELTAELVRAGTDLAQEFTSEVRVDLAKQLNIMYGINLPLNGAYSPDLKAAYQKFLQDKFQRSLDEGRTLSNVEFFTIGTKDGSYRQSGGTGGPDVFASISDPTQAASIITSVFKSELRRDPTSAELAKYTKLLQSAERRNPFKTVNGIRTGGLDKAQFIVGELQKLPEFAQKKTDKVALTTQSILGTAKANGVSLNQTQVDSFAKRIQDGTDAKIIDNEIRDIAGLGMPEKVQKLLAQGIDLDTIYSPYKNLMASILELNPESISLNDPTLRKAIGGDYSKVTSTPGMGGVSRGEYTMYDFEKALRKDYRWQYTDNAKREVSNVALKVLRDFGFQA